MVASEETVRSELCDEIEEREQQVWQPCFEYAVALRFDCPEGRTRVNYMRLVLR